MQVFKEKLTSNTCAGCQDPTCMKFSRAEITCNGISNFPMDRNDKVCATDAITWDQESGHPVINSVLCFSCGLCISRCKHGRIRWDGEKVTVSLTQPIYVKKQGVPLIPESDALFSKIYAKLDRLRPNYHNTVVRNLLIGLDCECSMRRIGDVYTRMDAVYSSHDHAFGAIEVEFGQDTLSASRGLLDDIAILQTRYGVDKLENEPLTVCLRLPNARQGYWQVVKDIHNVEGIDIHTLSVGALMLLLWYQKVFRPYDFPYYLDYNNKDLRKMLENQIFGYRKKFNISNGHLGILEPIK